MAEGDLKPKKCSVIALSTDRVTYDVGVVALALVAADVFAAAVTAFGLSDAVAGADAAIATPPDDVRAGGAGVDLARLLAAFCAVTATGDVVAGVAADIDAVADLASGAFDAADVDGDDSNAAPASDATGLATGAGAGDRDTGAGGSPRQRTNVARKAEI
jgi:hypothetical protein